MAAAVETNNRGHEAPSVTGDLVAHGVGLLSQQIWCWGQDVLRPEGNWLLEVGFTRLPAPSDRERCSSVYTLEPSPGRRVVLRGFGVFYGADDLGGVFLPRFQFVPQYTDRATLECPPWSDADLPDLRAPVGPEQDKAARLVADLIDWVQRYETDVIECLGPEYRREALAKWKTGKRPVAPADAMGAAWRDLRAKLSANPAALLSTS